MHVNKIDHVTTINRVAENLGESRDWLLDVANEMEPEDGVMAFTDFGIENLIELIKIHKDDPMLLKPSPDFSPDRSASGPLIR
jgi:hypothetical protein